MLATTNSERPSLRGSSDGRPCTTSQSCTSVRRDATLDPDHVAEHRDADLNAHAGEKPDQRRPGEEVGEESELEDAGQHEKTGGQERDHADQRHVVFARRLGHARKRAGENRGGRRIRRHDEMARRAEDGERDEGQKNRIEPGDDRRCGDPGIAEDLRNVHRRERQPGEGVAAAPRAA